MAASIKISELNSLTNLTDVDLFLVSDMESGTSKKVSYSSLKSSVTSDVSSALTSLTDVVSQNKTNAETLVETVRAALQAAVDNNATGYATADTEIDSRLDVLEADPTTQAALDAQVTTLNAAIAAVQADVNGLDIDIAPETLNSIDELSQALGDDPAFLSTLQSRIAAIESNNATQTELDAVNQSIQVSLGGLATDKLSVADPVFTGIISGPDIDIGNGNLTVAGSGGVVSNVGFFSSGLLSIGGNASFTDNVTFSSGNVNFLDVIKIDDVELTVSATDLNYVTGATSNIQTQITALKTSVDNLDIDIAPETLDSINELAAAMGDDPAFLTTLQGRVTTIEGDIATQTELDTYKAEIEDRNLQLALAYDTPLFVESLNVA